MQHEQTGLPETSYEETLDAPLLGPLIEDGRPGILQRAKDTFLRLRPWAKMKDLPMSFN